MRKADGIISEPEAIPGSAGTRQAETQQRLTRAEWLLAGIIAGTDHLAEGLVRLDYHDEHRHYLLVGISDDQFRALCVLGGELEDLEENGDAEPDLNPRKG